MHDLVANGGIGPTVIGSPQQVYLFSLRALEERKEQLLVERPHRIKNVTGTLHITSAFHQLIDNQALKRLLIYWIAHSHQATSLARRLPVTYSKTKDFL